MERPDYTQMVRWLKTTDSTDLQALFDAALAVTHARFGRKIYFRGLVEFGNICAKNCFYCGIRRGNANLSRFQMTAEQIIACARQTAAAGYGSIVLQAGERQDSGFAEFVEALVRRIKDETGLGVTLSLGEQSPDVYRRWREAGAHRYLLRIETSNRQLYRRLHPADHSYDRRLKCLRALRAVGYMVGTGVMIGLPGQTEEDLANDILFFESEDVDMIGMGPFVPHPHTPLYASAAEYRPERQLRLALVMIALARLRLPDVNIAAATALDALAPQGRQWGLLAGANVIMHNLTPPQYGRRYYLYEGHWPASECQEIEKQHAVLAAQIAAIGAEIAYWEYGDSPRFVRRLTAQRGSTGVPSAGETGACGAVAESDWGTFASQ